MTSNLAAIRAERPWVSPSVLLPLLESIETLPVESTGAYVLEERQQVAGFVLVQRGHVCWAVCKRMQGRLTDLLIEEGGGRILPSELERIYALCRSRATPLGEELVRQGLVAPEGLRAALFRHSCEALLACAAVRPQRWRWQAHLGPSYDAAFTFSPSELYVGMSAVQEPERARLACEELRRVLPEGAVGLSYGRSHEVSALAVQGSSLSSTELAEVGRWVASVLDVAGALGPCAGVIMRCAAGGDLIAWSAGAIAYLAACSHGSDLSYVIAKRSR